MKPISKKINRKYVITVPCCFCKKELVRNTSYLKKHPLSFCSESCKTYYNDPKQYDIMIHNNTPNFSYLIGLLLTDGHIAYPNATKTSKTYYAMIRLKCDDGDIILPKIQSIFGGKVYNETGNGYNHHISTCWRVSNKEFVQFLMSIGFTNNKTYTIDVQNWFNTLNEENKKAFMRGCWDGDGSVNINDRLTGNTKSITNNICSASKPFIDLVVNYFTPSGILFERTKDKNPKATCSLWYFSLNGNNSTQLSRIYDNLDTNDLVIIRKLKIWLNIKHYLTNIHKNRYVTSKYYGVSYCKSTKSWNCLIKHNYKAFSFATFPTDKDAAIAYDICTVYFNINDWKLNFPELMDEYKNILLLCTDIDVKLIKNIIPKLVQRVSIASNEIKQKNLTNLLYKGVQKHFTKFICYIHHKNKSIQIKLRFNTELEAAITRDKLYYYFNGDKNIYNLNFPEKVNEYKSFDVTTLKNYFTQSKYDFLFN
jgi:hypothetical protein